VFTRASDGWSQQSKLVADDGGPDDRFGHSVALSTDGSTIVVGAENDENPNGDGSGLRTCSCEMGLLGVRQRSSRQVMGGRTTTSAGQLHCRATG
jgi:hypothetical protein